jgi:hypothetical protein
MGSQLKRAHKTHALAQPAGASYPQKSIGSRRPYPSTEAEALFTELCQRMPDPFDRAKLLDVSVQEDEAWRSGRRLPTLLARRRTLAAALVGLRRE